MSTNNETTNTQSCLSIGALERNRFFYGKLLSVDDFQTEQDYFREKIRLLSKTLEGSGIISGLNVSDIEVDGSDLRLQITAGYALDCCGEFIVVDHTKKHTVSNPFSDDTLYLYIHFDECDKDRVASMSESSSCEESCCYNRISEIFSLALDDQHPVGIESTADCIDPALMCEHEGVLIAVLQKNGSTYDLHLEGTQKLRQYLLSNTQLIHLICQHVSDMENPHNVTAEQVGAIKSINNVQNAGKNIDLISIDGTIEITPNNVENTINLEVSETIIQEIQEIRAETTLIKANLRMVLRFLMDKALKYKLKAFSTVLEHFKSELAVEIVKVVREAIDKRVYLSEKEFVSLMEYLVRLESKLIEEIGNAAVEERMKHYKIAIEGLQEAMKSRDIFAIAVAQDEVCEMAEWLVPVIEKVKVPKITTDLIGKAKAKLFGVGLLIGDIRVQVSDKPESSVLKQDPRTGTLVEKGSQVDVVIAVKPDKVSVPNVTELYIKEANKVIVEARLITGKVSEKVSDKEQGTVLEQKPKAGTKVDPGSAVAMTIAKAPEMTIVPGVVKLKKDEAIEVLTKAKLNLGEVKGQLSVKPVDTILLQSPQAGTKVAINSNISVTVAIALTKVKVPNLIKKTGSEVKLLLDKAKLQAGNITHVSSGEPKGTIVGQSPEAGSSVAIGSAVDMRISKGAFIVDVFERPTIDVVSPSDHVINNDFTVVGITVPNVVGKSSIEASRLINASGLNIGSVSQKLSRKPAGTVLGQSPQAGTRVRGGSTVDLSVSKRSR